MRAIFKRELQADFYTASAYVYMGVFLALGSVFFAVGNLASRSGDLPGFLWNMGYLWMLLTPVLTMHVYAGERRSRTDQLLLTSPVSMAGIVLGKYLAACAVLIFTVALTLPYALVVALWGKVYPGEMLCGYLGFLLQGCAFLAIDLFVSARSRTPITAAVWAFGVNLLLWLTDVVSSAVGIAWIQRILRFISLYRRASPFQEGQLSLANALFFLAVTALMLFLTARALEARRFSGSPKRTLMNLGLCLLASAVAVAACAAADLWETKAAGRIDLSFNRVTTRSAATDAVLRELNRDVHAYVLASEGNQLNDLNALLDRYQAATPHFAWSQESLNKNPLLLQWVSDDVRDSAVTTDCVILRCEETGRTRVLTWDDYMRFSYDDDTGSYAWTGLTYEQAITEALVYVTAEELPRVQILTGHGELTAEETAVLEQRLRGANYEPLRVSLSGGSAPDPAYPLMILSPILDLGETEAQALAGFAQAGGSVFATVDFTDPGELPNLYAFYRLYGVQPRAGLVLAEESDAAGYYTNAAEITPEMLIVSGVTDTLAEGGADFFILAPARALEIVGTPSADLMLSTVLQTRAASYLRAVQADQIDLERRAEDPVGPFPLAVLADRAFDDGTRSRFFLIGNSAMFTSETILNRTYSGELLLQVLRHLTGEGAIDLDIVPRQAMRPELNTEGSILPLALVAAPPLLIAILAVAILMPRRYL